MEANMKRLFGVTVPMITPLNARDEVNEAALKQLTNFLIEKGVNCLYPTGTTGEMYRLTLAERKKIAEIVVNEVNGRIPVFIHIGAINMNETLELAKHAHSIGADGVGAVTPSYFSVNDREMEEYYVTIAKAIPDNFPLYLYNIPQCSGNDLKPGIAQNIANRCPNVIGIKYSYVDLMRTLEYLKINDGKFEVILGADYLFHTMLIMGCKGVVSGVAGVYPEPYVEIFKAFKENDQQRAGKYQKLATTLYKSLKCGSNMAYYKAALEMRGIDAGHMRRPQLDLTPGEKNRLRKDLEAIEQIN
jgi:4-hydroxy-tetrahydrodipicolinate synthase